MMSNATGGSGPPGPPNPPAPLGCNKAVPANPWAPNNPWASPWPVQMQPSVDFVTLKLDGLEIGFYRFQGGTLPHEVHVVVPRAEIERRSRGTDGTEEIRRTVLSSITIAHAPRYPFAGQETPEGAPRQPAPPEAIPVEPMPPAPPGREPASPEEPPSLPRAPRRPFYGEPAPPGQAPSPTLPRSAGPSGGRLKEPLPPESGH